MAEGLAKGCMRMYVEQEPFGLSPENVQFNEQTNTISFPGVWGGRNVNLLRPETLESLYYLAHYAKSPAEAEKYRRWGKFILTRLRKHSKHDFGFSTLNLGTGHASDKQESFFMAETLKYGYLLFAPKNTLDLNRYVLTTEAHPVLRWDRMHQDLAEKKSKLC
ncbi:unnamed protein product [Amoebophrya sp. A25]|nr:unnamed protein product [Amoebophrya sp. A25]|eukprot:GSA25T00004272001.1